MFTKQIYLELDRVHKLICITHLWSEMMGISSKTGNKFTFFIHTTYSRVKVSKYKIYILPIGDGTETERKP